MQLRKLPVQTAPFWLVAPALRALQADRERDRGLECT